MKIAACSVVCALLCAVLKPHEGALALAVSVLAAAGEALGRAADAISLGMPSDFAALDINEAISSLGEITGETVSDDIVNEIFHSFCVGK